MALLRRLRHQVAKSPVRTPLVWIRHKSSEIKRRVSGATYREAHLAMEIIADHGRMLSFEIVEVNPVIDEHNQTADVAFELSLSASAKKIL